MRVIVDTAVLYIIGRMAPCITYLVFDAMLSMVRLSECGDSSQFRTPLIQSR
jgi:hypothetical protein